VNVPDQTHSDIPTLADLGWTDREQALFAPMKESGFFPGRVSRVDREFPLVATSDGAVRAEHAVHLVKTRGTGSRAVVGDWVALSHPEGHDLAIIETILPRTTAFARKDPAENTVEQVLIANVDVVFVVQALSGRGINVRRLERELVLAWESGAVPVVVLTKADVAEDIEYQRTLAADAAPNVDIIVESAVSGLGVEEIRGRTGKISYFVSVSDNVAERGKAPGATEVQSALRNRERVAGGVPTDDERETHACTQYRDAAWCVGETGVRKV